MCVARRPRSRRGKALCQVSDLRAHRHAAWTFRKWKLGIPEGRSPVFMLTLLALRHLGTPPKQEMKGWRGAECPVDWLRCSLVCPYHHHPPPGMNPLARGNLCRSNKHLPL